MQQAMKRRLLASVAAGTLGLSYLTAEYLFNFAFKRVDYVPETSADKQKYAAEYWRYVDWFKKIEKEHWTWSTDDGDDQMSAYFIPADDSAKAVIISHGYKGNGETMANYAKMFHELGFNVLLPDDRGHGQSAGKYISFGWLDRLDYLTWLNRLIKSRITNAKQANNYLTDGVIDGILTINDDFSKVRYKHDASSKRSNPLTSLTTNITALRSQFYASKLGLTPTEWANITKQATIHEETVNRQSTLNINNSQLAQSLSEAIVIVAFFLISYISIVGAELGTEKGNHLIEGLLAAIPAKKHYTGKMLGI